MLINFAFLIIENDGYINNNLKFKRALKKLAQKFKTTYIPNMDNMASKQEKNSAYSNPYVTQLPKLSKPTDSPANEKANATGPTNDKQIHDDE